MSNKINTYRLRISAVLLFVLVASLWYTPAFAQRQEFEEIVVEFEVKQLLKQDLFVQYSDDGIYLPLIEIFHLLDIYIEPDFRDLRFTGYYLDKSDKYSIDLRTLSASVEGRRHDLTATDFVVGTSELYLKLELFNELFDLRMKFDFAQLQVRTALNKDFPSYKKLKRHQAHKKLSQAVVSLKDVRRLPRKRPSFGAGVLDWAVSASPVGGGGQYFDFTLGSMLMRGDLKVSGSGNSTTGFESDDLTAKWHYYHENSNLFTQIDAGHVFSTGLFARQIKGALVTNRPQIPRKFFQTIEISGFLGADWEVELYVNNRLTDFVYTDQTGRYDFSVDIFYGTSEVMLRMYGPNGEIKTERQYVDVPYSLVPKKTFEYTVAGGSTEGIDRVDQSIAQASGFYGVTERLTVGLSSDMPISGSANRKPTLAAEATYQITGNLTGNTSLAPGYAIGTSLNFGEPSVMNAFAGFTKYYENEFLNRTGLDYRLLFSVSSPLKIWGSRYPVRYSLSVNKFPQLNSINMNYGFNASLFGVALNYLGRTKILKYATRTVKEISSEILASPLLFKSFRPQIKVSWDHSLNKLEYVGLQFNRRIFRQGQLNVSVERNLITNSSQIKATFRLFTGFADFTTRMMSIGGHYSVSQVQRGSVRYDQEGGRVLFDRRNAVGSGAAVVRPFLDHNYNGSFDEGEELLPGLKAKFKGGRQRLSGDQFYYYDGLRAYDRYLIQIDEYSLDNPLLKPTHENYEISCNPNVVTAIDVPLVIGSEVSGRVTKEIDSVITGLGGARVMLLNLASESVLELASFSNGEFFYLGLVPGSYRAYIDPEQLSRLGYVTEPESIDFVVDPVEGGTVVENINFKLSSRQ